MTMAICLLPLLPLEAHALMPSYWRHALIAPSSSGSFILDSLTALRLVMGTRQRLSDGKLILTIVVPSPS